MKNPKHMTKSELTNTLNKLATITVNNAISEFIDQWDLPEELKDDYISYGNAKDISKQRWKSTKTVFTKSYDKEVRQMKNDKKLDFKLLGFLTFIATYTHYEDNTLRNEDGTYMSKEDIIRETDLSEPTVRRYLDHLIKEEIMWKKENELDKTKNKYYLTPELFYKGVDIDREIKEYFKSKREVN